MRKFLAAGILAILCSGCCGTLSRENAYHDGVKQYVIESGLLDEYDKYVLADPALKPTTKQIRVQTSAGLRALITEEEKALKKD